MSKLIHWLAHRFGINHGHIDTKVVRDSYLNEKDYRVTFFICTKCGWWIGKP